MSNIDYKKIKKLLQLDVNSKMDLLLNGEQERTRQELTDYKNTLNNLNNDELKSVKKLLKEELFILDNNNIIKQKEENN